ncbi:putative RNA-directed DNA polymerase, partial [Tanacetum coccineum]
YSFVTNLNKAIEPKSYKEASTDNRWVEAMNKEMEALNRNNTWEVIVLPKGRKLVGCKWIFKIKYKSNGDVERYKAILVAKGYSEKEGLDYVKMVIVRCVLSHVVQNKWSIFQLDINNAFLYSDLEEYVYMSLPDGFVFPGDQRVCKLKRYLYGLKQSPRKWNESNMEIETDTKNMTTSKYPEYKAAKERRLWDDVRSRRSPTKYNETDVESFHRNK